MESHCSNPGTKGRYKAVSGSVQQCTWRCCGRLRGRGYKHRRRRPRLQLRQRQRQRQLLRQRLLMRVWLVVQQPCSRQVPCRWGLNVKAKQKEAALNLSTIETASDDR